MDILSTMQRVMFNSTERSVEGGLCVCVSVCVCVCVFVCVSDFGPLFHFVLISERL